MKESPLISVIIPVYNYDRYLAEAIESVLSQTYHHLEAIVVDDGSTDQSAEIARSFAARGIRYCYQVHAGIGPARNKGVELAQGDFLAFLDADDRWPQYKTERQLRAFESDPTLEMVFGQAFSRVGKFQSDWKVGEFIDWYARAVELKLCSLVLPDLLLWRRIHDSNQGVRERQSVSDYARVLKAKLDRKRAEGANVKKI